MSSLAAGLDDKNVGDIEEEFEFLERLGAGTYGEVWKACHKKSNKLLAIKKIRVDRDTTDLLREISIMKKCVSPWVVRYYGNYFKDDVMWIIMEYCSVGSVNDLMCITKKTLNEEQIAAVCRPTAQGLDFMAKNNKIHRDIKPHNILLNSKGEAKLADFGISRDMSDSGTKRKTVIGTPFYLAPEVIKETGYDTKADIWALGISAIEMAEKNPPYHDLHSMRVLFLIANNPPPTLTHPEHWSEEFNDFIAQCLKKEPNERPSAEELLSHPFLKKGAEEHLVTLIEDGERIIREHGGFELTMKAIASANADDSDDDTISLDGLNEGMGELSDPASSGDSFGLFDLPIASAKFNDDDSDDHSDYEVPVSPRVSAPKESPVPASPTPNIVLTPSTPLRKAQAAIMLTPTNRRSAELRVSDQGSKRRNSIDWSGLMEPGSQGTPDNKRKARRASVTIRTNETLRPALNRVDSQNKSNREINSLLAELDAIDRPTSPSNSRDNLLPTNTGSDAVTKRRSFTTASAASTSFVRNNPSYQVHQQLGVWRGKVAAKNPFRNNPQWVVTVNRPCQLCIAVKSDRAQLNIGFYVLQLRDIQHRLAVLPSYGLHSEFPPVRAPEVSSQLQFQDANMKYVIVPYAEQLPLGEEITYDLFMLTPSPDVKLSIKPVPDMEEIAIQGEWKGDTAGGCINFSSWRNNPQYYLHIKRAVDLYIFLTQNDSLLTHIGLYCIKVPAPPQRKVLFFERESLVTRDSKFHKKTEITPGKLALEPGHYILMPTTYAPGTTARFTLSVLAAYKAEGNNNATRSFMLSKVKPWEHSTISGAWTSDTAGGCMNNTSWINNPKFHFNLVTKNELTIVLHRDESASKNSTNGVQSERPFIGFYLFKAELGEAGTLSRDKLMHKTKNFLDLKEVSMSGLSLERGSYLIVPCTYNAGYQGAFGVTVYTDLDIIALNPVREQATLIKGAWSHVQCTAGGCINFPTWRSNAQYYLELEEVDDEDVTIDLVLEQEPHNNNVTVMSPQTGGTTKAQLPHIGFLVVKAPLQLQDKLMQLTSKDVIASAEYLNDYRVSKRMTINTGEWRSFVIIPTTFYPKEENSFTLRVIGPHITKLTRVSSNWVERAHEAAWSKSNNTCGGCMNNPTWLQNPKLIVFSQKTARYFLCLTQHLKPHQNPKTDLLAVGFYVFRKAEDAKLTFTKPNLVGKSEFSLSKDVLLELNLPAGTYIIIPAIFQAGKEANFSFTVYGSDDFGLTAL